MKFFVIVVLFVVSVCSDHIGYVGLFQSADCSGNPAVVSPVFEGDSELCHISSEDTCLRNLAAITTEDVLCQIRTYTLLDDIGIVEHFGDGGSLVIPFGFCFEGAFLGCSVFFSPATIPFTITEDTENINEPDFAGFLNYFTDSCEQDSVERAVEMRVPVFEGETELCYSSTANTCNEYVQGFSSLKSSSNLECHLYESEVTNTCSIRMRDGESHFEYQPGECYQESHCQVSFSNGFGYGGSSLSCQRKDSTSNIDSSSDDSACSSDSFSESNTAANFCSSLAMLFFILLPLL